MNSYNIYLFACYKLTRGIINCYKKEKTIYYNYGSNRK